MDSTLATLSLIISIFANDSMPIMNTGIEMPVTEIHSNFTMDKNTVKPNITANSWLIADADNGKIIAGNDYDTPHPIASIAKLATIITAAIINGNNWDKILTVPDRAVEIGGSSAYLKKGQSIPMSYLLDVMMVKSGNDAAYTMAYSTDDYRDFVDKINRVVKAYGAKTADIRDPAGVIKETVASALDVMQMMRVAIRNERIVEAMKKEKLKSYDNKSWFYTTNKLYESYIADKMIGGKTGTANFSGKCLVTAFELNRARRSKVTENNPKIIVVVLNSENRFEDTKKLVEWAERYTIW